MLEPSRELPMFSQSTTEARERLRAAPATSEQGQRDYRAELQRLVTAFDRFSDSLNAPHARQLVDAIQRARTIAF